MFQELIVQHGPLLGLFISSLTGSTIFIPLSVEALFPILIRSDLDPYLIVIIASMGALMGTWINYLLGYFGSGIIERKLDSNRIDRAKRIMNKYGWPGLFIIIFLPLPLPIPVDPITIFPGIARMNFIEFSIVVFFAKLARYSFFVGIFNSLLGLLHL
ncbi:MAG TPA: DedA family protein [Candidatus Altiarchaeales archaeon]|nr:DedA family protein [Candidatus Altiarchaeales archaeon]